jgi:hypothetical protein
MILILMVDGSERPLGEKSYSRFAIQVETGFLKKITEP